MTSIHSWVTAAPESWTRGRLKTLIGSASNGTWGDEPIGDGTDVSCVRAADFDRIRQRVSTKKIPLRHIDNKHFEQHKLRVGDIILEKSGGGEKQPVGAAVLFDLPGEAVCSNFCSRITPAIGIDSEFLTYAFAAAYTQGLTQNNIKQTTGIQNLDAGSFLASPWAYPDQVEQRRIVAVLDAETARIDRLAALQREVLSRLTERDRALRDGLMDRLLADVGEVPMRRFVTRIDQGASPQCESTPRSGHEWGVLKLSAVKQGRFISAENKRLPGELEPQKKYEVRARDFLVTRANTPTLVGDVAVADGDVKGLLLPDLIYRVGLVPELDPEFAAEVALSSRVRLLIEAVARGSSQSMVKLRGDDIREWPIPAAGKEQQRFLVRGIRDGTAATEKLRQAVNKQLALLAERRQALITAAVTGQIDVSTASGRGVDVP